MITGFDIKTIYMTLRRLGLVQSKAGFSVNFCGRSQGYLRGCRDDDVPAAETLGYLAHRLTLAADTIDGDGGGPVREVAVMLRTALFARLFLSPKDGDQQVAVPTAFPDDAAHRHFPHAVVLDLQGHEVPA